LNLFVNTIGKYKKIQRGLLADKFRIQFSYGQREVLLKFANLEESSLLIGILQHGVGPTFTISSEWPTPRTKSLKRSRLWVYSKQSASELIANGATNVFPIGSPWLYSKVLDKYENFKNTSRLKFLVFPRHYDFTNTGEMTDQDILERIKIWKSIAGSADLEICLYWTEFFDAVWQRIAREEGVPLVCAGIPNTDPLWHPTNKRIDFYKNLRRIIDSSTHCIFEGYTSAIFYANDLGKNVGIYQSESEFELLKREPYYQKQNLWLLQNVPGLFKTCQRNETLDSITHELLGYEALLNSVDLARVLRFRKGVIPKL
jgi:hypothetical protein